MHKIITRSLMLLMVLFGQSGFAVSPQDLLSPEQAFRISADGSPADRIRVKWRIEDGYYLYKNKIRFATDSDAVTLAEPEFPPAQTYKDEFFGEIDIYRDQALIEIPVIKSASTPDIISLSAKSQGCADVGICYPPQTQTLLVAMSSVVDEPAPVDPNLVRPLESVGSGPAEDVGTAATDMEALDDEVNPLQALDDFNDTFSEGDGFGIEEDDILQPEEAYQLSYLVNDKGELQLDWQIAEGTYLYNDKIKLSIDDSSGLKIGSYSMPKPKVKQDGVRPDGTIGDIQIYKGNLNLTIPVVNTAKTASATNLTVSYQGCAERGICYPPVKTQIPLQFPAAGEGQIAVSDTPVETGADKTAAETNRSDSRTSTGSEEDQIASMLKNTSTFAIIGIFFLIGLGLAFTPCVFPMIPILSGIISGQDNITTGKATYLSVIYVLAMAVTYTVAGVFAAMSGENLQILLQIPWVIAIFAGIFVLLAFSMFGFYELQLPSSLQSKLTELSNRQSGGNTIGVAIMGLLSALIVGPCVAPPLAGVLLYISQTNDPVLGGLALFAMSMGMGVPLILIGASAGKLLPRAGAWMDTVKAVFGVSMLGLAIYFLERILPETVILLLWGSLLVASSIYMGALSHLHIEATGWQKLWKGLGVILLIYGATMLIGAAAGSKDVRQPLKGLAIGTGTSAHGQSEVRHFKRLTTMVELDQALAEAKAAGKPAVLDFYADWCVYCKTLENEIFPAPESQAALADAVLLQADVTEAGSGEAKALMQRFGVIAPPVIVFWDKNGNELKEHKIVGDVSLDDFVLKTRNALQ